ncbi:hypothetical protein AACH06_12685 [Ideonella sp. DXS29W]|uniref:DUF4124 domain-containing protein n=1 Tax=Ideonella lacteola TaxID=2984193 RepID=A0ABU9BP03_9BURK
MTTLDRRHRWAIAGFVIVMAGGWAAPGQAADKTVYRCGQTYQQVPCGPATAASASAINTQDTRTADQRADAKAAVTADKRRAQSLAAERRERNKALQPQQAPMGLGARVADEPSHHAASSPTSGHSKKRKKKKEPEPERYVPPPKPPAG